MYVAAAIAGISNSLVFRSYTRVHTINNNVPEEKIYKAQRTKLLAASIFKPHKPPRYLSSLTRAVSNLLGLAVAGATVVEHTRVVGISADVDESGGVSIDRVNAGQLAAIVGSRALNVDVALALAGAVAARAVQLAVVLGVEVNLQKISNIVS